MDVQAFAHKWMESWNSHNLDQILEHYSNDIVVTTPMIRLATGGKVDSLEGKEAVRCDSSLGDHFFYSSELLTRCSPRYCEYLHILTKSGKQKSL